MGVQLCHYPNGKGRQENAGVAGLPVSYFIQTDVRFQERQSQERGAAKKQHQSMITIRQGHDRGRNQSRGRVLRLDEMDSLDQSDRNQHRAEDAEQHGMFLVEGNEKEPLGKRILETPENAEATEVLRDPHSSFFAYVPVGSIKRGEALATKANAKTTQCASCHGADLKGLGPVPGIAGRSPAT